MLLVTGITGHTGRYFLQELIDHKYEGPIRCIVRETSNTSMLDNSGLNIEKVYGDLNNKSFIRKVMNNVTNIMHIYNIHHSPMIVEVAIENNVKRAILVHTMGIYSNFKYASQGYKIVEKKVSQMTSDPNCPTKVTVLRPTMIYGDLCDSNMSKFIKMIDKFRVMPVINGGRSLIQPVNARDLGKAFYTVLTYPEKAAGKDYVLSGEKPLKMIEVFRLISNNLNKKITFVSVPLGFGVVLAQIAKGLTLGKIDYVESVQRMGEDRSYTHTEAKKDFSYNPMSFKEGIQIEVNQYLMKYLNNEGRIDNMKIAVLSSHTSSLFWFRMDMMKAFIEQGHSVVALGPEPESNWKSKFEECGIQYKQLFVERNGINPFSDLRTYQELKHFMKEEKPDKIFAYQAKTVVYGSLAAKVNGITEVYPLIAGLGSIFRGEGLKNKVIKMIMKTEYRLACNASKKVFFQNTDDKNEFINNGIIKEDKIVIINGSGVNLEKFRPEPLPDTPAFLFIGRLIKDKGVMEYLEACKKIKSEYPEVRCLLVGPYDSNPSALQPEELQPFLEEGIIEYFGEQTDVRPYLQQCSTYVLPSYHEGTPKTVLEAMAIGRSIITSDAPGCSETVTDRYNGFLVSVKDVNGLVDKMRILIEDQEINSIMAERSLKLAKEKYDVNLVNKSIMKAMRLI